MAERRMFRYVVPIDDQPHELPLTSSPVAVAIAEHRRGGWSVEFWAEDDSATPATTRAFQVFGTGHVLPGGARWVGTCPRTDGLVFHLYEVQR